MAWQRLVEAWRVAEWGVESEEEGVGASPVAEPDSGWLATGRQRPVMTVMTTSRIQGRCQRSASENHEEEFNRKHAALQSECGH